MLNALDQVAQGSWHKKAYTVALYVSYALFAIAFTGVVALDPKYLGALDTVLKYYVSLFLMIRFNPWAKRPVNKDAREFDRRIAFAGGVFLLLTTTAAGVVRHYAASLASRAGEAISI
tara:strand:- start:58 stop:411 length:354 start_codon:yes stop_codon:yes gene_type:complete